MTARYLMSRRAVRDHRRQSRVRIEPLEPRLALTGDVLISEFMASNGNILTDGDGDTSDWIEIHNAGNAEVDLRGWYVTDDARVPRKWQFPSTTLAPGQYSILFASGKNRRDQEELHTNFKLGSEGEYVALVSANGDIVSEFGANGTDYPAQFRNMSYGHTPQGARYFAEPTPGEANVDGVLGVVDATSANIQRGFFDAPIEVELTSPAEGTTIRYTTDGTSPTETLGFVYDAPISIASTTILRAAAFKSEFAPSRVSTHSYIFLDDVLQQDQSFGKDGSGLPSADSWGHSGPDWEVDPAIVNHPLPEFQLTKEDLRGVPTMSLVLPWDDMFGSEGQGIYIEGDGIPRAASLEQIQEDGSTGFQIDASVQIQGNTSVRRWKLDKLSMRVKFTEAFGPPKLNYPLFGDDAAQQFDTFILDSVDNFSWNHPGPDQSDNAKYIQDQYVADIHNAMGGVSPHGRFQHLYINGLYWGMYYLHERADESFAAAYLGGERDAYDVLKHNQHTVVNGSNEHYLAMLELARQDLTQDANYQQLATVVDIDGLIDYMISNFYVGNLDWGEDNWYASRNRVMPDGKWRFHSWDAEESLTSASERSTVNRSNPGAPTEIHQRLIANAEYRLRFADHVQRHYFNDGVLTPENAANAYLLRMEEVDRAIVGESARWGDNRRETPYTRQDWLDTQQRLLQSYFPQRTQISLEQLQSAGLYPDLSAPALNQHGGRVSESFDISLSTSEGLIYFTSDGTDPRLPGGAISSQAAQYSAPLQLSQASTVKARTLHAGVWSALTVADFVVESDLPLRITEINFHPHDANALPNLGEADVASEHFEFVELVNTSNKPIDLAGVRLVTTGDAQGVRFTFTAQTLEAGEHIVVVRDPASFQSRYGQMARVAEGAGDRIGAFGDNLANDGERLTLLSAKAALIQQFDYATGPGWPQRTQGYGSSLEVVDPLGDYDDPSNWRATSQWGGSPGWRGQGPDGRVLVNEVLANSTEDRIELRNNTNQSIDVGQWYLSDARHDLFKFQLAPGTTIPALGYLELDEQQLGFDLSDQQGAEVWLLESDDRGRPTRFVDVAQFTSSQRGVSLGRWPEGDQTAKLIPQFEPSFGAPNGGPRTSDLVISEVHYHPSALPEFAADFNDNAAAAFSPVAGTWAVNHNRYEVIPSADADGVSILPEILPLERMSVSATIHVPSESEFDKNASILIDYHGPTDFKFAGFDVSANRWRIGQRDANGWHVLAEETRIPRLRAGRDVALTVEILGPVVTVSSGGAVKVRHTFDAPIGRGSVGLATQHSHAIFDDVTVRPLSDLDDFEYVEVTNAADTRISLDGWGLRGGIHMDFETGTAVDRGDSLILVGFDPSQTRKANDFRSHYGIAAERHLVGPYQGNLADDGAVVMLMMPVGGDDADLALVDYVDYQSQAPWPAAANGTGLSLHRKAAPAFANSVETWTAGTPDPGLSRFLLWGDADANTVLNSDDVDILCHGIQGNQLDLDLNGDGDLTDTDLSFLLRNLILTDAGDVNVDGVFDSRDLVQIFQVGEYEDDVLGNSDWSEGDWNCDGDFDTSDLVLAFRSGNYVAAATSAVNDLLLKSRNDNLG